jgi:hypothetical protein
MMRWLSITLHRIAKPNGELMARKKKRRIIGKMKINAAAAGRESNAR